MASIAEPPAGAKVDRDTLGKLVDQASAHPPTRSEFLDLWARGKVAAKEYPAALETLRMLRPSSVDPADL